ncbi:MAG TPA: carbonic anhydrase [Acidimicrobiia bacterium]
MDGRIQRKVSDYLSTAFGVRHLDTITTAGLIRHVAADTSQTASLLDNVEASMKGHGSNMIAVVAHHDCAGNPVSDRVQKQEVANAMTRLAETYPGAGVIGLWLNEQWIVERIRTG